MNNTKTLTFVDFFSGAGGLSLGLQNAGLVGLGAIDFDADSIATYNSNFKHPGLIAAIEDLNRYETPLVDFFANQVDIVAGGPPCQGFSVQRRGEPVDSRNLLVPKFGQLIVDLLPRAFILENVTGILGRRGKPLVEEFLDLVGTAGYQVQVGNLRAFDYGVAQLRSRIFIVGFLDDKAAKRFAFPAPSTPSNGGTVRSVIGDLMDIELGSIPNHTADRLSPINLARIRALKPGQSRPDLPIELQLPCQRRNPDHRHLDTYGRMNWDSPAPTITARFDSFSRGRFGHPVKDRTITLREGARLQGFPDWFEFTGRKVSVARQIGNAVPPPLAKAVGEAVRKALTADI